MPSFTVGVPAATAVLGYDLFTGESWQRTPQSRVINELGVTGSAVIGDSRVELLIDEIRIGTFYNSALLVPQFDSMVNIGQLFVPGGALLRCLVRDAPVTSVLYIRIDLSNV